MNKDFSARAAGGKLVGGAPEPQPTRDKLGERLQLRASSLVALTPQTSSDFLASEAGSAFSRMKHGDADVIRSTAEELARLILEDDNVQGVLASESPSDVCLISPAFRKMATVGVFLVREVQKELSALVGHPVALYQMHRKEISCGDFAAMTADARSSALANQFYLTQSDRLDLASKFCIFIDDALMYGTHYTETINVLMECGVQRDRIHGFFAAEATPELLQIDPHIEHAMNARFTPTLEALQDILRKPTLCVPLRLVKLLLELPDWTLQPLCAWMETDRPDAFAEICKGAAAEDLPSRARLTRVGAPARPLA